MILRTSFCSCQLWRIRLTRSLPIPLMWMRRSGAFSKMSRVIANYSVRIYDEFPGHQQGTFKWAGELQTIYMGKRGVTKSGLFCFSKELRENQETANCTGYRGGDEARRPIPPGEWVEYTWAIRTAVDFFMFLSRFVDAYDAGQDIHINLKVGPLAGRKLVTLSHDIMIGFGAPKPCRRRSSYLTEPSKRRDYERVGRKSVPRL